jgi:tRNA (cmo5U34)-methyltransferase
MKRKSTPEQIRQRFDADVERFSNLDTGQEAAMDSRACMEMIARGAAMSVSSADVVDVLDIGCGAGNYTLMFLQQRAAASEASATRCTLLDLSLPMLDRASARIADAGGTVVHTHHSDVRLASLGVGRFDVILAASVLHHLRGDDEWADVFRKLHAALKPAGSLWVFDLIDDDDPAVRRLMHERYGEYLVALKGEAYRDKVFAYVDDEDTPRSLEFQRRTAVGAGFAGFTVLHKNGPFAAYCARR